jgi:glycine/serine hydroxymethyltransferase
MGPDEMRTIGGWILKALKSPADEQLQQEIRSDVFDLCEQFPVPASRLAEV